MQPPYVVKDKADSQLIGRYHYHYINNELINQSTSTFYGHLDNWVTVMVLLCVNSIMHTDIILYFRRVITLLTGYHLVKWRNSGDSFNFHFRMWVLVAMFSRKIKYYLKKMLRPFSVFLSYLLSIILSPAVFDGPEWDTFTWKHRNIHTVHLTASWFTKWPLFTEELGKCRGLNNTYVLRIPPAAQRGRSSRGCRRSSKGETHPSCRTTEIPQTIKIVSMEVMTVC